MRYLRLLLADIMGVSTEFLLAYPEQPLGEAEKKDFLLKFERLINHEPLSRILGRREFWGLEFLLSPETLDPRADSETLIRATLGLFQVHNKKVRILDLGTGTGCLLISLLKEMTNAEGVGIDQSSDALKTAAKNAAHHKVLDRAQFIQSDWFQNVVGTFDIIISNPPYISEQDFKSLDKNVKDYDPKRALVGGGDGLDCYREIVGTAKTFIKAGGVLVLEAGYAQAPHISKLLSQQGYQNISIYKDLAGIERCIIGTNPS